MLLDSAALIIAPSPTEAAVFCLDCKIVLRSLCPRSVKAFEISIPDIFLSTNELYRWSLTRWLIRWGAVLKVYIFTNKHSQVNLKRSREMVKRIGLVLVFFAQLIRYVLSQRGEVRKAPKDGWIKIKLTRRVNWWTVTLRHFSLNVYECFIRFWFKQLQLQVCCFMQKNYPFTFSV